MKPIKTIKLGKSWISIDKTGVIAWLNPLHKNYYLIPKNGHFKIHS